MLVAQPLAAQTSASEVEVRIAARRVEDNRVEFALQQRRTGNTWGDRQLPRARFLPADAAEGRWLASTPLTVGATVEVRIAARRVEDNRVEFALQQRRTGNTWGDRQLPRARFLPADAAEGRWLASTPLTVGATAGAADRYTAITAGSVHNCLLRTAGTVACWGDNYYGQADAPDGRYIDISAGGEHTCAIRADGTITCWGYNDDGQLDVPDGRYTKLSAGGGHTCALRADGTATCWGDDTHGRADAPDGQYTDISASYRHSCAIRTDGTIACWGHHYEGETDAPDGQYTKLSPGIARHTCALRADGTAACWGANFWGQTDVPNGRYTAIAVADSYTCAVRTNGAVTCWGDEPEVPDLPDGSYTDIAVGTGRVCAIRTDGAIVCSGASGSLTPRYNAVGLSPARYNAVATVTTSITFEVTMEGETFTTGQSFTSVCGRRVDGSTDCWGDPWPEDVPVVFADETAPTTVETRPGQTCTLNNNGTITCSERQDKVPDGRYTAIAADGVGLNVCAVRTDGVIVCWGEEGSTRTAAP